MAIIKFNGVRKSPGRPTLVEGIEGRRYVDGKILKNLENTQRTSGGYNAYTSQPGSSPFAYTPGQALEDLEYGLDQQGLSEPLTSAYEAAPGVEAEDSIADAYAATLTEFVYDEAPRSEDYLEAEVHTETPNDHVHPESLLTNVSAEPPIAHSLTDPSSAYDENFDKMTASGSYFQTPYSEMLCIESGPMPVFEQTSEPEEEPHQSLIWEQDYIYDPNSVTSIESESASPDAKDTQEGFQIGELFQACVEHNSKIQRTLELSFQRRIERASERNILEDDDDDYYAHEPLKVASDSQSRMKTGILRLPSSGVVRSSRGTIELLVHSNGLTFKPNYNLCGMLVGVTVSDGRAIEKNTRGEWRLKNADGKVLNEKIEAVSFDKKGNLWYRTKSGKRVTFFVDGHIETVA